MQKVLLKSILKKYIKTNHKINDQIATQLYFVVVGVKMGYLWDIGPPVDVFVITQFITELHSCDTTFEDLRIVSFPSSDICVLNIKSYLKCTITDLVFVNVTKSIGCPKIIDLSNAKSLVDMLNNVHEQLTSLACKTSLVLLLQIQQHFCVPTIFGILCGFPIVYWYDSTMLDENSLSNQNLMVFQAFHGDVLMFSISCPYTLINADNMKLKKYIDMWFSRINSKLQLDIKTFTKSMEQVIL